MLLRIGDIMNKKSSNDKIPVVNYFKLAVVIIITVLLTFLLRNWYISGRN